MSEHTPIPWEAAKGGFNRDDGERIWGTIENNKWIVAEIEQEPCGGDPESNAALIVRCVNSHDALVEALESMLSGIEGNHLTEGDCNQARAALAAARK